MAYLLLLPLRPQRGIAEGGEKESPFQEERKIKERKKAQKKRWKKRREFTTSAAVLPSQAKREKNREDLYEPPKDRRERRMKRLSLSFHQHRRRLPEKKKREKRF